MHAFKQPIQEPAPISMVVLGDSLAYGLGATNADNGLAHLLFRRVRQERPGSTYANFGVPHATMGDVSRHQLPLLHRANPSLVVLIAGANDLRFTRDSSVIGRRFRKLLEEVHNLAPRATVVAAGMPDIAQTTALPGFLKPAGSRLCRRMNEAMRRIAADFSDEFIDLFLYTNTPLLPNFEYMCEDGFHPCDYGHAEIAERAYPTLARALNYNAV